MKIKKVELFHLKMPLKFVFKTSQTQLNQRETLILRISDELGNQGYGEVVAFTEPFYTGETLAQAKKQLVKKFIPLIQGKELKHPFEIHSWLDLSYPMTRAGLENALLDLYAKGHNQPIMETLFAEKTSETIEGGIVLGDLKVPTLVQQIEEYTFQGYSRFKIKIKSEDALKKLEVIRSKFPDLRLLADGNQSFTLEDLPQLKRLDELGLFCLEEPLAQGSIPAYQKLQGEMATPICLDESIQTMADLMKAIEINACQVVNLKVGRVGGLYYVKEMIKKCREYGIQYWIGSMLESGVSKILHVHLASLEDNYIPGDLSPSARYFIQDIIRPEITAENALIPVPQGPGIGVEVDEEALEFWTIDYFSMI